MTGGWRRMALGAGIALGVGACLALWDSRFHVVPLTTGGAWRGVSDPPGPARLLVSLLFGAVAGWALSRRPRVGRPLLALGLAAAPLVPVLFGVVVPLLAFQGPVLILVAGAALAVAFARARPEGGPGDVPGVWLFAAPFVFYVALAGRIPGAAGPQGDEPHYLAMAHSLWTDGDLDLADEWADREYAAFYPGPLAPHVSPATPPGRLYSLHSPGLPLLIFPAYALGGFFGTQVAMSAIAALVAWLVHRTVREACGEGPAALAFGLIAFTPPLPFYAASLYPELPAALGTAVALRVCQVRRPHPAAVLGAALLLGFLPWLHSKFLPLAAAGLALLLLRPMTRRIQIGAALVFTAAVAGLLALFARLYGQATLSAAFGPPDIDLGRLPGGVLGMLLDRQFGLFPWSPAWVLALVGWPLLVRTKPGDGIRAAVLAAMPIGVGAAFATWWGGSSPPARFILPALPAFALALAPAAGRRPYVAAALGGAGLALVGFAADAPRVLHNRADGESLLLRNLNPSLDLNRFLPSFLDGGSGTGRPLVDPRLAAEDLVDAWDATNLAGPKGPPRLPSFALGLELQKGPWVLAPGEARNSRRTQLYPGDYQVEVRARPAGAGPFALRVVLGSGEMDLAEALLTEAQPAAVWPLLVPAGVRSLGLSAAGLRGEGILEEVRIVPVALVPRSARGRYVWPAFARPDRYRVGGAGVHATALDRSTPEGGGFRIAAPGDRFVVDGPAGATVEVHLRWPRPEEGGGRLVWGDRSVALPAGAREHAVRLPLGGPGHDLGRASIVPVVLEAAPGTWVRFAATGAP